MDGIYYLGLIYPNGWHRWWFDSYDAAKGKLDVLLLRYPDSVGSIVRLRMKSRPIMAGRWHY